MASGQLPENCTDDLEFIGELALDGQLRPVTGILSIAIACQQAQHQLILPSPNAQEASQLRFSGICCQSFTGSLHLAQASGSSRNLDPV